MCESSSAEHLINSAGISSCPLARLVGLLSLPIASVTSSDVIGRVICDGSPVNASSPSTVGSVNCRLKWSVTRVLISAELEMMRPASSWNVSCVAGLLVNSRTARNIFAPSWRRSTAILSSLSSVFDRAFRRIACNIALRCNFRTALLLTSRVFCRHSFSFLCSADIAAISGQCGVYCRPVGAVRHMVDSAASFAIFSTELHLSLAEAFVLISGNASETESRNFAR